MFPLIKTIISHLKSKKHRLQLCDEGRVSSFHVSLMGRKLKELFAKAETKFLNQELITYILGHTLCAHFLPFSAHLSFLPWLPPACPFSDGVLSSRPTEEVEGVCMHRHTHTHTQLYNQTYNRIHTNRIHSRWF